MANITTFRTVSTFRALSLASDSAVICVTEALASDGVASFGRSFLALARLLAIQTETAFRTGGIACVVLKSGATRTFACKVSVKDGKRFKMMMTDGLTSHVMARSSVFTVTLLLAILSVKAGPARRFTQETGPSDRTFALSVRI